MWPIDKHVLFVIFVVNSWKVEETAYEKSYFNK